MDAAGVEESHFPRHGGASRSPPRGSPVVEGKGGGGRSAGLNPGASTEATDVHKMVADLMEAEIPKLAAKVSEVCIPTLRNVSASVCDAAVQQINDRMDKLEQGQSDLQAGQEKMAKQLGELSGQLTAALGRLSTSSSTPDFGTVSSSSQAHGLHNADPMADAHCMAPDVTSPGFYRKPNPSKLFCNTMGQVLVPRASFYKAVVALAAEAGILEEHFDLEGEALDNRFEILFKGPSAAARAVQFYQSLQLGRGKWKVQEVVDDLDEKIQLFVQPDKKGAQIRREILAKELKQIIAPLIGNKTAFIRKSTGSIMVDRRVLATIFITGEFSARIQWAHAKRIELGIDDVSVEQQFAAFTGGPNNP